MRTSLILLVVLCGLAAQAGADPRRQPRAPHATLAVPEAAAAAAAGVDAPAAAPAAARSANYQISAGDVVAIRVFREPELDSQQRVSKDGTFNFPLLGVIRIAGMTTNDAAAHIAGRLKPDYILNPQVSVSITTYNKEHFTVLGSVASPGTYDVPEEQAIDLLGAIARAGGMTRLAQPKKVLVRRNIRGKEDSFEINVDQMMKDRSVPRFVIEPNDIINVTERFL